MYFVASKSLFLSCSSGWGFEGSQGVGDGQWSAFPSLQAEVREFRCQISWEGDRTHFPALPKLLTSCSPLNCCNNRSLCGEWDTHYTSPSKTLNRARFLYKQRLPSLYCCIGQSSLCRKGLVLAQVSGSQPPAAHTAV